MLVGLLSNCCKKKMQHRHGKHLNNGILQNWNSSILRKIATRELNSTILYKLYLLHLCRKLGHCKHESTREDIDSVSSFYLFTGLLDGPFVISLWKTLTVLTLTFLLVCLMAHLVYSLTHLAQKSLSAVSVGLTIPSWATTNNKQIKSLHVPP